MKIKELIKKTDGLSSTIDTLEKAITSIEYGKEKKAMPLMLIRVFVDGVTRDAEVKPDLLIVALSEQLKLVAAEREPLKKKIEAINLMLESN